MYSNLTNSKQLLLDTIIEDLKDIRNVSAIVLGGSYAEKMATIASDLDIGIYYEKDKPFDIKEIERVAQKYAIENPTVTDFYQWGPFVNGGAWISTSQGKVDFLYRNINQVADIIEKAKRGEWENCYEQQPPYGFSSIFCLAEVEICVPLYDPDNIVQKLKDSIRKYPQKLKESVISQSLWSAEFTIWHADGFAQKNDIYNLTGCLTRAVKDLTMTLFAVNETYPLGDKRAIDRLGKATIKPNSLVSRIDNILCVSKAQPSSNVVEIKKLFEEVVNLSGSYHSLYRLYEK